MVVDSLEEDHASRSNRSLYIFAALDAGLYYARYLSTRSESVLCLLLVGQTLGQRNLSGRRENAVEEVSYSPQERFIGLCHDDQVQVRPFTQSAIVSVKRPGQGTEEDDLFHPEISGGHLDEPVQLGFQQDPSVPDLRLHASRR